MEQSLELVRLAYTEKPDNINMHGAKTQQMWPLRACQGQSWLIAVRPALHEMHIVHLVKLNWVVEAMLTNKESYHLMT